MQEEEVKKVKFVIDEGEKTKLRETVQILQNEIDLLKRQSADV